MSSYDKPFKTYDEQIKRLSDKYKLIIHDKNFAIRALQVISYYDMINGYQECMMENKQFKPGISIELLYMFYLFDKRFQDIIFRQTMLVENYFKTELAYVLAQSFGEHQNDYLNPKNFNGKNQNIDFATLKSNIEDIYTNKHHKIPQPTLHYTRSHNHIPPWILFKNISFGQAINLFTLMKTTQKLKIVNSMIPSPIPYNEKVEILINSLNILRKFRNQTAHNLKFVTYKDKNNKLSSRYLTKIILPYMLTWNDIKKHNRGLNDIYCVIILLLYLISVKDNYIADNFCNDMLHHITPYNESDNEVIKASLFQSYANITGLPIDFSVRINKFKEFLANK